MSHRLLTHGKASESACLHCRGKSFSRAHILFCSPDCCAGTTIALDNTVPYCRFRKRMHDLSCIYVQRPESSAVQLIIGSEPGGFWSHWTPPVGKICGWAGSRRPLSFRPSGLHSCFPQPSLSHPLTSHVLCIQPQRDVYSRYGVSPTLSPPTRIACSSTGRPYARSSRALAPGGAAKQPRNTPSHPAPLKT